MRARDLRDIIDVLVLPSLERALEELEPKRGSRAHAATQLRGVVVQPEADRFNRMRAAEKEAASTTRPLDLQRTDTPAAAVNTAVTTEMQPSEASTEENRNAHDFSFEFKLGNHLCRCGAAENGSDATRWCPLKEQPGFHEVSLGGSPSHGHDFSFGRGICNDTEVGKCRCGAVEDSEAASQNCGLPVSMTGTADG